jgi:Carbohydrate binding module (family 6)/Right handed beta helix region/Protein of unknown function (DUF1565)
MFKHASIFAGTLFLGLGTIAAIMFMGSPVPSVRAAGTNYHVAGSGNDANQGTQSSPFRTIQKCASVSTAGDTCNIRGGFTYSESVGLANSGTSGNPITYQVEPGTGTATLKTPFGGQTRGAVFNIAGKSYITVQNLTFDGLLYGWAIRVRGNQAWPGPFDAHHITIQNNSIKNWGNQDLSSGEYNQQVDSQIEVSQASNVLVQNNLLDEVRGFPINFFADDGNSVIGNTITHVHQKTTSGNGINQATGIQFGADTNLLIKNNTIAFVGDGSFGAGNGIWCDTPADDNNPRGPNGSIVDGNIIHDHGGPGIVIEAWCNNVTVQRNVIYNGFGGIRSTEYGGPGMTNDYHVFNNTVYNNQNYGFDMQTGTNAVVRNNIFMNNGSSQIVVTDLAAPTITLSNNLYLAAGTNIGLWNCVDPCDYSSANRSFSSWLSVSGETNSKNIDPKFVNASAGDFHLQSTSPAIDAGTNVGLPYNGSAPDMGALEFGGTSGTPTPTPTLTPSQSAKPIPGRIEAEDYNTGGEGVGYHDLSPGNTGGAYRSDDVDIKTAPGGIGYTVGYTQAGEWLAYTLTVQTPGTYATQVRAANGMSTSLAFHLEVDGTSVGTISVPSTGSWGTETTVAGPAIALTQGTHTLKVVFDQDNLDLNYLDFTQSGGPTQCAQYTPSTSIPTGFASPYDVVSAPATNLMQVTCDPSTGSGQARIDLGKGDPLQYIYNQGYLYKTGGTNWIPVPYTSAESLIANAWYPKTANTTITLTSTELANTSYNLAYICSWTGSSWKCGCRDSACTQSYWQIQSFKR